MFFIALFSIILYREFSVVFRRSKNVVVLYTRCSERRICGNIVIEGPSNRFEEDFCLGLLPESVFGPNSPSHIEQIFPADLDENSNVYVELYQDYKPDEKITFDWNSQIKLFYKEYNCFSIQIIECSSNFPANKLDGRTNCQSLRYILPENLSPTGYLELKFNSNSEPDLRVKIDTTWETETFNKRDYNIDRQCVGLLPIWDEEHLLIQVGNENWFQLNINNPGEAQVFQLEKITMFYKPYNRYVESVYHYILYIKNIDDRKANFVLTDEILISLSNTKLTEPRVALNRKLRRLYPGNGGKFEGRIEGFSEAKRVMVQIKTYEHGLTRDILVIPVIYNSIEGLNQQIVIFGSKKNFVAILVLSTKPITSLTELYLVTIKNTPNVLRFQFCVKSVEKSCQFKDTDLSDSYQQVSVNVSLTEQLVLKSGKTEWTLSTKFRTDKTTTSTEIGGIQVEVDIRRMPKDEKNSKWSEIDDRILRKVCSMPTSEKSLVKKNLPTKATNL